MSARPPARERLLDAADELVATRGWAATPVDVVLARAEVAPATLYAHFGSKDRLLGATLDRRLTRWDETWSQAVATARDDRGRVLAVFDALGTFHAEHVPSRWCTFLGAAAEGTTTERAVADAVRRDTALLHDRLAQLARPLVEGSAARAEEVAAHLLVVVSGCLAMRLREPAVDHVARGRVTAALVLDGLLG